MGTTAQKLQKIEDTKAALGAVISSHGGTVPQTFAGYPAALGNAIDAAGVSAVDALCARAIGELVLPTASEIVAYLCRNNTALTRLDAPNVQTIGTRAFEGCANLRSVNLPKVSSVASYAFQSCSALSSIDLPELSGSPGTYMFRYCTGLTSATCPKAVACISYMFYGCTNLISAKFEAAEYLYGNAFNGCSRLREVHLPSCVHFQDSAAMSVTFSGTPANLEVWLTSLTAAQIKAAARFPFGAQGTAKFHGSDGYVLGNGTIVPA